MKPSVIGAPARIEAAIAANTTVAAAIGRVRRQASGSVIASVAATWMLSRPSASPASSSSSSANAASAQASAMSLDGGRRPDRGVIGRATVPCPEGDDIGRPGERCRVAHPNG